MTHLSHISHPAGVAAGPGYSHVVSGTGRLVVVSGQVSLDADGNLVGVGDPDAQASQVFENIGRCLESAGAAFSDVVKLTWFVTDLAYLPALRAARDLYVDTTAPPASSAVQVAGLVRAEFLMEVEALALVAT
jgi:enamine deaminase RidA (YjgF/YER057c/UK114 family)